MNSICLNGDADLRREPQVRRGSCSGSPCSMGALVRLGKACFFQEFSLIEFPLESVHNYKGFFTSAVTTTKDSLLNSAGCGVKIGDRLPLGNCLAALVERLHNLSELSGKMFRLRNELIRHAHLAISTIKGYCGEGKQCLFLLPL